MFTLDAISVAWTHRNADGTTSDAYIRRSTDSGTTWGGKTKIGMNGTAGGLQLAVSGRNVWPTSVTTAKAPLS